MIGGSVPMPRDQAVFAARSRLSEARRRFLHRELPPLGNLIVRQQVPVPDGAEWPWALVSAWPNPATLRGRSLNDGAHPSLAHIRMGRHLLIRACDVIDWAIIDARGDIVAGAWTRRPEATAGVDGGRVPGEDPGLSPASR